MNALRWEIPRFDRTVKVAYSGHLAVGMIGTRDNGEIWYDANMCVISRGIKTRGNVASLKSARAAVNRAWSRWCAMANLAPKP